MTEHQLSNMANGILLLIVATSIEIFREIYSYFTQYNLFFGFYTTGAAFNIINSILLILSFLVIYGYVTLSSKLYSIIIAYYGAMILNYAFVLFNAGNLSELSRVNSGNIIFLHSLGILLFILTIWYLVEKKMLFIHKKDDTKSIDDIFIVVYSILFLLMIILSFIFL